jgi:hypothetical protein
MKQWNVLEDFQHAIPLVMEDRTVVSEEDLQNIWELSQGDIVAGGFDHSDPYYYCRRMDNAKKDPIGTDCLRETPNINYLSLVPLIESHMVLEEGLIEKYLLTMGNSDAKLVRNLELFGSHPEKYFRTYLKKEPKEIHLSGESSLVGYRIAANFGIGSISSGGMAGSGIRSDSPFIFEVFQEKKRGEYDLAAIVGFWAQNNSMLVSQMQSGRGGKFPEKVLFGIGCMRVAESAAMLMGFDKVYAYSANTHPIFQQYPEDRSQMLEDFKCFWDGSSKKLGYQGTRCSSYVKQLKY